MNVEQEVSPDRKGLVFVTDRIENIPDDWRARETYTIINQDEYVEVFELAEPAEGIQTLLRKPLEAGGVMLMAAGQSSLHSIDPFFENDWNHD